MRQDHAPSEYWFKQGWIFITTAKKPYVIKTMYFASQFGLRLNFQFHHTEESDDGSDTNQWVNR